MVVQPPAGTYFNPRSPHGERQDFFGSHVFFLLISIHAPRTGSDGRPAPERSRAGHFNPRSPHGERRIRFTTCRPSSSFQSTLPARGATKPYFVYQNHVIISIHAPRTGSDNRFFLHGNRGQYFNPRSPHGERRRFLPRIQKFAPISIHAPRTGSDTCLQHPLNRLPYFNPRSPHGERLRHLQIYQSPSRFQSTLPARGATRGRAVRTVRGRNFNPRSPHGERHMESCNWLPAQLHFNPRSPHGERPVVLTDGNRGNPFQSTLPARGATDAPLAGF